MRPTVLGLCGKAGSGKSSVRNYLFQEKKVHDVVSFALPLKRMVQDIWGFSEGQIWGDAKAKECPDARTGIVPRWAMQKLGEAARNRLWESIWIDALERIIKDTAGVVVIEDVRYRNEVVAINSWGGYVWRLHCPDSISIDDGRHPSEAEVDLIPPEHIHKELRSSRAQGLDHLFGLVDSAWATLPI